ncbi:hydrogenase expression/formation protein HypE [Campylobacter hyointestinalis]|uniref:hydrogenase expression/formation protein HypE n=1 Tax=Campylobacter hyointestinalis TaxID=198 RepID=UPI0025532A82|nr:hydrogenase expression/formation protein HypE [Campylobacter hyointestinalis]MDL2346785.1 hydrogenase expression/formation protein HypE [Campylobacter hyointestinalis]MDL2348604.1 hydrogenase expression/formation protein HypE [Campylobacter hyointestinalis]MDL2350271.1 hydrogenase expression/formation protein HypE [Campylobacter hyointestinalis]MDM1026180.1 hydrogenase expression/formation protein HypE [Campylobacter hyointestinalis]MDM1027355.1 hydrogenase expression/formation protein HypE
MQKIMLAHGGGGQEMNDLINGLIFKIFNNEILSQNNDSAILNLSGKMAFSTDSFVVSPTKFPGGDIGKIAVCGTINDLAMVGAKPRYISCALIIEEGFDINELKDILSSMKSTADEAGVAIVCGDTKVVSKGSCDKIFINTSGVGEIIKEVRIENLKSGAKILLSGDVGRHGAVVLASRNELRLQSDLQSDCKPLYKIVEALLNAGITPLAMRDATRGGLSAVLNEWANFKGFELKIYEEKIKIKDEVSGICELLGFEAYELANEGTFVIAVDPKDEEKTLEILRKFDENANTIGEVVSDKKTGVIIENIYGSSRYLEVPKGELLPRIC